MKKADNFDASKWLTENKITTQSRLNEETMMIPSSLVSKIVNMKSRFGDKAGDPTIKAKLIPIITDFFPKNQDVSFQELENKFGEETARQTIQVLFGAYLAGHLDSFQKPISRLYNEYRQIQDKRDGFKGIRNLNEMANLNEEEGILALIQKYVSFHYTADQGYGVVAGDDIDPITKKGKPVDMVDYAESKLKELETKIINIKGAEYFAFVEELASLLTYDAEYAGPEDDLLPKQEELASKLGFTLDQIRDI